MNQIRYISQRDKENLINEINKDKVNIQVIDGRKIKTLEQFCFQLALLYRFPSLEYNLDGFYDWMCDIDLRFNEKEFALIIDNYDEMMNEQIDEKRIIMSVFIESILYWWDEESMKCYKNQRINFNVYIVNSWKQLSLERYLELKNHQFEDKKIYEDTMKKKGFEKYLLKDDCK